MSKRLKLVPAPIPPKFQPGDRVKPAPAGIEVGWCRHGTVIWCGQGAVRVQMDGDPPELFSGFPVDYMEAE